MVTNISICGHIYYDRVFFCFLKHGIIIHKKSSDFSRANFTYQPTQYGRMFTQAQKSLLDEIMLMNMGDLGF